MRLLMLTLTLLVSLSSNSFAITNGQLYQDCKPFADRAFKGETHADVSCVAYFRGVSDFGVDLCASLKSAADNPDTDMPNMKPALSIAYGSIATVSGLGLASGDTFMAAIQLFVNEMAASPEKWEGMAAGAVHASLRKVAPCE